MSTAKPIVDMYQVQGMPEGVADEIDDEVPDTVDVTARFNLEEDLASYLVAKFLIEKVWDNPALRNQLFVEYGIRDEEHFRLFRRRAERYIQSSRARRKYGSEAQILLMQRLAAKACAP